MFKKTVCLFVCTTFVFSSLMPVPRAHADAVLGLPEPGAMVNLTPAYESVMIKGLTVHADNPLMFDFIVDTGHDRVQGEALKKEGEKLAKYFLASLALPEKDVWVNLSPYEKDRTVPEALGQTDMGRDMLAQDYILKQLTSSLIYPEKDLGKEFWQRVYAKAQQLYGTSEIPVNTFNKVWIMADRAEVFERNQTVFVLDRHLKVMLEEDYLALDKNKGKLSFPNASIGNPDKAHSIASQIVREIVLPEIEKEVNTGKNFATLRQIFNAIILASWYKNNLKDALLNQVYADQAKVKGIDLNDPKMKDKIYAQYLAAYKKGVFNYIKEDVRATGETIPRKYFSGGVSEAMAAHPQVNPNPTPAQVHQALEQNGTWATINIGMEPNNPKANANQPIPASAAMGTGLGDILTNGSADVQLNALAIFSSFLVNGNGNDLDERQVSLEKQILRQSPDIKDLSGIEKFNRMINKWLESGTSKSFVMDLAKRYGIEETIMDYMQADDPDDQSFRAAFIHIFAAIYSAELRNHPSQSSSAMTASEQLNEDWHTALASLDGGINPNDIRALLPIGLLEAYRAKPDSDVSALILANEDFMHLMRNYYFVINLAEQKLVNAKANEATLGAGEVTYATKIKALADQFSALAKRTVDLPASAAMLASDLLMSVDEAKRIITRKNILLKEDWRDDFHGQVIEAENALNIFDTNEEEELGTRRVGSVTGGQEGTVVLNYRHSGENIYLGMTPDQFLVLLGLLCQKSLKGAAIKLIKELQSDTSKAQGSVVKEIKYQGNKAWRLTDAKSGNSFSIDDTGLMYSLKVNGRERLLQGQEGQPRGKPVMIPWNGRLPMKLTYRGRTADLRKNKFIRTWKTSSEARAEYALHGMVAHAVMNDRAKWTLEKADTDKQGRVFIALSLDTSTVSEQNKQLLNDVFGKSKITLIHRIAGGEVSSEWVIENKDDKIIPWNGGEHDFLNLGNRDDWMMRVPANKSWGLDTKKKTPLVRLPKKVVGTKNDFRTWFSLTGLKQSIEVPLTDFDTNENGLATVEFLNRKTGETIRYVFDPKKQPNTMLWVPVVDPKSPQAAFNNIVSFQITGAVAGAVALQEQARKKGHKSLDTGLVELETGQTWNARSRMLFGRYTRNNIVIKDEKKQQYTDNLFSGNIAEIVMGIIGAADMTPKSITVKMTDAAEEKTFPSVTALRRALQEKKTDVADGVKVKFANGLTITAFKGASDKMYVIVDDPVNAVRKHSALVNKIKVELGIDAAMGSRVPQVARDGGIDLNTKAMTWIDRKQGRGVAMTFDAAMVARIREHGIENLTPVVYKITPIANIWPLAGFEPPKSADRLAAI